VTTSGNLVTIATITLVETSQALVAYARPPVEECPAETLQGALLFFYEFTITYVKPLRLSKKERQQSASFQQTQASRCL
jgi:hypothetical protein